MEGFFFGGLKKKGFFMFCCVFNKDRPNRVFSII